MAQRGAVEGVTASKRWSLSPSPQGVAESWKGAVTAAAQCLRCLQQPQRMALLARGLPFSASKKAGIGIDESEGKLTNGGTGFARIEHRQHVGQPAALVLAWRDIGSLERRPVTCAGKLKTKKGLGS